MQLGSFVGPEKIDVEFKEHRIDSAILDSLIIDKSLTEYEDRCEEWDETSSFVKSSTYKISDTLLETPYLLHLSSVALIKTIEKYVGRYAVAFANTDISYGELNIGISDSGEIIGVPIHSDYRTDNHKIINDKIREYVIKTVSSAKDTPSTEGIDLHVADLLGKTVIEIVNVDVSTYENFGYTVEKYFGEKSREISRYRESERDYCEKYGRFLDLLKYYKRPINTIVNSIEIRDELCTYINSNKAEISEDDFTSLMATLASTENIIFETGEIMRYKIDKCHIAYWITRFRDEKINCIIENRPVRVYQFKPLDPYYQLLRDFRPLVHKFAKDNVDIILIKIRFPGKKILAPVSELFYNCNGMPQKLCRSLDQFGQPCCKYVTA